MATHDFKPGSKKPVIKKRFGPKLPDTKEGWFIGDRLFVVLEMASLETVKTRKGYELLNSHDHHSILNKAINNNNNDKNIDISMYRQILYIMHY